MFGFTVMESSLLLAMLLNLAGLAVAVHSDNYISKKHRTVMFVIIAAVFSLIAQNTVEYEIIKRPPMPLLRTCVSIYGYIARPIVLVLAMYIVAPKKRYTVAWIAVAVNAAVYLTALFSPVCFYFDEYYTQIKGPLGYTAHIISLFLLLSLTYCTIKEYAHAVKKEIYIPVLIVILLILSILADTLVGLRTQMLSYLTIAMDASCVFYYIWLHLQFVRRHEKALLAEQRIQIMMSQIQPHFLYNTLSAIQALCLTDPEQAFDITARFGQYLRRNIDSLNNPGLIPIEKEIEHTRVYTDIEMIRFSDISVEYDISDAEFMIPALSVQPLVENAIRYGVRMSKNGLVTVSTRERPKCHEVVIHDNGAGFDTAVLDFTDDGQTSVSHQHIGIRNVKERIEKICGGTLDIESSCQNGTTITINIPKGRDDGGKT